MNDLLSSNGALTPDGARLIAWIEAQFAEADKSNDLGRINSLAGYLSYYYVNVHKLQAMKPEQWIAEHLHSGAAAAWRDMTYFEEVAREQAEKEAKQQEQVTGIAGQIEALQKALAEAQAEIAALKEAKQPEAEPEKPARKSRKAVKAEEAMVEPETEAAGDEAQDETPAEDKPAEDAEPEA